VESYIHELTAAFASARKPINDRPALFKSSYYDPPTELILLKLEKFKGSSNCCWHVYPRPIKENVLEQISRFVIWRARSRVINSRECQHTPKDQREPSSRMTADGTFQRSQSSIILCPQAHASLIIFHIAGEYLSML
jgi:hypothetical protein